ncbi:hypothetical protein Ddye_012769 [Dipteronia dyeriana]|uniref:Uncharacterized protein n=1 Tax=Dipteronia dyeriana TaxID=168575 RepID=A0AAD9X5C8_9ROSI|nr:hypothetical protein Ddye_012769 [Dipteronia dyeriana]
MGSVISKAADSIGSVLGNAFAAPFKTIVNASSCEAMGCNLFRRAFMCLQSDQTAADFGPLLLDLTVLLLTVPSGDLPVHRKKPMQYVLGCL